MGGSASYRLAKRIREAEQNGVPQEELDELRRQRQAALDAEREKRRSRKEQLSPEQEEDRQDAAKIRERWQQTGGIPKKAIRRLLDRAGISYDEYADAMWHRTEQAAKPEDILSRIEKTLNVDLGSKDIAAARERAIQERINEVNKENKRIADEASNAVDKIKASLEKREQEKKKNPWADTSSADYEIYKAREKILKYASNISKEFDNNFKTYQKNNETRFNLERRIKNPDAYDLKKKDVKELQKQLAQLNESYDFEKSLKEIQKDISDILENGLGKKLPDSYLYG